MPKQTAMTVWDKRLADLARAAKKTESAVGGGGNFISLRGGIMTYNGAAIPENKMRVIVLDAILENQWYAGTFDPDNFASPSCYAFGRDPEEMAPNPEYVESPVSAACSGCQYNEWGSADVGRGKACKEVRRLALITEGDMDNLEDAEVAYLKVPVTSVKGWAGHVRQLDEVYHKPPLAFITEISVVKEQTNKLPGWHLDFHMANEIKEPEVFEVIWKKYEEVSKNIAFPYPKTNGEEKPKPRRAAPVKTTAPKTVARKTATSLPPSTLPAAPKLGLRRPVKAPKF